MESVLLLNSSFEPLRVISWQRAVCMLFGGKVEIIEEYGHDIRSVSLVIKAPAVVRLLQFVKIKRRTPPLSRANVLARDDFQCQYCGKELAAREATFDHIVPKSQGGQTTWQNIVSACGSCNRKKGGRTPEQAGMKLKKQVVKPDWLPVITMRFHGRLPESWKNFVIRFGTSGG